MQVVKLLYRYDLLPNMHDGAIIDVRLNLCLCMTLHRLNRAGKQPITCSFGDRFLFGC